MELEECRLPVIVTSSLILIQQEWNKESNKPRRLLFVVHSIMIHHPLNF